MSVKDVRGHQHFIKTCMQCEAVIMQCRCPSLEKEKIFGICQNCISDAQEHGKHNAKVTKDG